MPAAVGGGGQAVGTGELADKMAVVVKAALERDFRNLCGGDGQELTRFVQAEPHEILRRRGLKEGFEAPLELTDREMDPFRQFADRDGRGIMSLEVLHHRGHVMVAVHGFARPGEIAGNPRQADHLARLIPDGDFGSHVPADAGV